MQHAEYFKDFLKDVVNIDDTRLNNSSLASRRSTRRSRPTPLSGP